MQITSDHNRDAVRHKASLHLNLLIKEHQAQPILLMLSAGSALNLLHDIHPEYIDERVTIAMLDERFSRDHTINNFSQMTHLPFYKLATMRGAQFINTRLEDTKALEYFTRDYESKIRKWNHETKPLDSVIIATMGLGEDGHTAGIMPYPQESAQFKELFDDPHKWMVGYDAQGKNEHRYRVTATPLFLRKIDHSIMYVTGENKAEALSRTLSQNGSLHEAPARIIHEMKNVQLFTTLPV